MHCMQGVDCFILSVKTDMGTVCLLQRTLALIRQLVSAVQQRPQTLPQCQHARPGAELREEARLLQAALAVDGRVAAERRELPPEPRCARLVLRVQRSLLPRAGWQKSHLTQLERCTQRTHAARVRG